MQDFYILAGPDTGVRHMDIDGLMDEFGAERGIDLSRDASSEPIIVVTTDPLLLLRVAKPGEEHKDFAYFRDLIPSYVKLPEPRRAPAPEPEVAAPARPAREKPISRGAMVDTQSMLGTPVRAGMTFGEITQAMVALHESGELSYYHFDTEVVIRVPQRITIRAKSPEDAQATFETLTLPSADFPDGAMVMWDPARVVAKAVTDLDRHGPSADAGWSLEGDEMVKLSKEEMLTLAQTLIRKKLEEYDDQVETNAEILRAVLRRNR